MSAASNLAGVRPALVARVRAIPLWELALGIALAAVAYWQFHRAFTDNTTFDIGLAYEGGKEALRSGHPEHVSTWISTPFLGMAMAFVAKVISVNTAQTLLTVLNVTIIVAIVAAVWLPLRSRVPRLWWWVTLTLALLYAPAVSSLWWKQMNLPAFGLAILGFWLARRGRPGWAGLAVAVSIGIKPLVVLLPLVMIAQRATRRAGVLSLVWGAVLLVVSQVFLAWQADDLDALSPWPTIQAFSDRSKPANIWSCHAENFAPGSMLCRMAGGEAWGLQRGVVIAAVVVLAVALFDAQRGRESGSWAAFATACLLSPMISPIAWSHYQLLMAPMLLVLAYEMIVRRAPVGPWALLVAAYALAALIWRPYGTLPDAITHIVSSTTETQAMLNREFAIAQFGQYVLAMAALAWFSLTRVAPAAPTHPVTTK